MIEITINAYEPQEVLILAGALADIAKLRMAADDRLASAPPPEAAEKPAKKPRATPAPTPAPAAEAAPAPTPATGTASPSDDAPPTLEQVRAVLAGISQAGKAEQVRALLVAAGAARLTEIDPSKYQGLLDAAKEIA